MHNAYIRMRTRRRTSIMTKREQFISWLGDAHAMEVGIVSTLEKQIAEAKGIPAARKALTNHLRETKRHAAAMKKALSSMGGSHPYIREGVSKLVNIAAGLVPTASRDTVIKNAITAFATEHFEIACYQSLVLTATELGEREIASTCKAILKEEMAMAKTLSAQFPALNATYLASLDNDKPDADSKSGDEAPASKKSSTKKAPAKKVSATKRSAKKSARR